jgi:hypothetical protein
MKILTLIEIFENDSGLGRQRIRMMRAEKNSTGPAGRLFRIGLSVLLFCGSAVCWAGPRLAGQHRAFVAFQARPHVNEPRGGGGMRQGAGPASRPGQEHLPAWWQAHRGLSPQQQADAMRREPGFRSLPPQQQQRLLNRLRNFDQRPPQVQQRMLDRMEMFERLSPERQQEVRGASQALAHMSPERQVVMRHAFQQLRGIPPEERQRMLNSGYGAQFSPQERTVLGNLLSIEPYQQRIIQPYFGR